jgi:hypothetical protein
MMSLCQARACSSSSRSSTPSGSARGAPDPPGLRGLASPPRALRSRRSCGTLGPSKDRQHLIAAPHHCLAVLAKVRFAHAAAFLLNRSRL